MDNFYSGDDEKELEQNVESTEGEDIEFDESIDIEALQKTLQQHIQEKPEEIDEAQEIEQLEKLSEAEKKEELSETLPEQEATFNEEPPTVKIDEPEIEEFEIEEEIPIQEEIVAEIEEEEPAVPLFEESTEPDFSQILPTFMQTIPTEVNSSAKKYVIYIEPENIDFMEKLSLDERKVVINNMIKEHTQNLFAQNKEKAREKFMRHAVIATLTVILGFPILFFIVNKSVEITIANYKIAQENFIRLYRENKKRTVAPNAREDFSKAFK